MKQLGPMIAAVGAFLAGHAAYAAPMENEAIQRCMDTFAAQHFPSNRVTFVVRDNYAPMLPLIASTGTQAVQLSAQAKRTGEVLATATCQVRLGNRTGEVVVLPLESRAAVQ